MLRPRPLLLPGGALALTLTLAWFNLLLTARWASIDGALHGWRLPWYTASLALTTMLFVMTRRRPAVETSVDRPVALGFALLGSAWLLACLFSPPSAPDLSIATANIRGDSGLNPAMTLRLPVFRTLLALR